MNKILIFLLLMSLASCSSYSLKKSLAYSFATGATSTGAAAYLIAKEPTKNKIANAALFGTIGGVAVAGLAYLFHKNNPLKTPLEKRQMPEHLRPESNISAHPMKLDLGPETINIMPKFNSTSTYKQNVKELPQELKGIFPTPLVEVHKMEDQVIKKGARSIYLRGCEAVVQTIGE